MNNKGVGAVFCLISALLMSARYLTAAIFMSNSGSWDAELFRSALKYVGPPLLIASVCALIAGVIFLAAGVAQDRKRKP